MVQPNPRTRDNTNAIEARHRPTLPAVRAHQDAARRRSSPRQDAARRWSSPCQDTAERCPLSMELATSGRSPRVAVGACQTKAHVHHVCSSRLPATRDPESRGPDHATFTRKLELPKMTPRSRPQAARTQVTQGGVQIQPHTTAYRSNFTDGRADARGVQDKALASTYRCSSEYSYQMAKPAWRGELKTMSLKHTC